MVYLATRQGNSELADYYRKEKEKMNRKQEKGFPIFAILLIGGFIFVIIMSILGG